MIVQCLVSVKVGGVVFLMGMYNLTTYLELNFYIFIIELDAFIEKMFDRT